SLAGVMAWQSSGTTSYSVGTKRLVGLVTGTMTETYLNPTTDQTVSWDPAIWDTTSGPSPVLRP
ncbi:MAG: hypothetical protein KGQ59_09385, partial [Bdellovibrionales bacterium]|nr:hypothetical protein [Bdellovibrionales bacterium]